MLAKIKNLKISHILFLALFARLVIYPFYTLTLDFNTFSAWSHNLAASGFKNFYTSWSDYLPGYLYVLWLLGKINELGLVNSLLLYKFPAILADLATGYLIYKAVKKASSGKIAKFAAVLYLFNPAVLANSTLWGQVDGITAMFSVLTLYLLPEQIALSALALAAGMLIKPQVIFITPAILYMFLKKKINHKQIIVFGSVGITIFLLAFVPFTNGNIFHFVYERLRITLGQYPYTSINALNYWGIWGFWKADDTGVLTPKLVGYGVSAALISLQLGYWLKKKYEKEIVYYLGSLSLLTGYTFFTRIHERHMLPFLAPFLIFSTKNKKLLYIYFALSGIYVLNLTYAYVWISENFRAVYPDFVLKALSALVVVLYFATYFRVRYRIAALTKYFKSDKLFFKPSKRYQYGKQLLFIILSLALLTRLLDLNLPTNEYFDEVYHAFTARRMLHGDPKAWEWWNPHPTGFAWEWTHPPMAKLGMILGMVIFGENAFGWRIIQAILGTACIFLTYKISKSLFNDELAAILAAAVLSLDGLTLVMSRIGMNDIYFLFFMLMSLYLFIKDNNFASALMLGFAAASKWTVFWFVPLLFAAFLLLRKKFKPSLVFFVVLPPLVYVLSYLPMFASGHDFSIFTGVQKQMWWYHTNLKATHYYTSPWWSWPLMLKPIWLYTSGVSNGHVANIYALGNPIIFWFGLVSIIYTAFMAVKLRNPKLALVACGYFVFFVPWALSPRIMFLYHYLPSLPFLAIAAGLALRRNGKLSVYVLTASLVVFVYLFPHLTGLRVPVWLDKTYYFIPKWK